KPSRLLTGAVGPGAPATSEDLHLEFDLDQSQDDDDADDEQPSDESKILKLFEAPAFSSQALAKFLRKLFGSSNPSGGDAPGGELRAGSVRRSQVAGPHARPLPVPI